mmetsp:Transcript_33845/g.86862  ORF Transcript_33845/g.86862 Transcript_33845/m.86862 type:complete len:242 (-) Transcript_33845:484-1209(-)
MSQLPLGERWPALVSRADQRDSQKVRMAKEGAVVQEHMALVDKVEVRMAMEVAHTVKVLVPMDKKVAMVRMPAVMARLPTVKPDTANPDMAKRVVLRTIKQARLDTAKQLQVEVITNQRTTVAMARLLAVPSMARQQQAAVTDNQQRVPPTDKDTLRRAMAKVEATMGKAGRGMTKAMQLLMAKAGHPMSNQKKHMDKEVLHIAKEARRMERMRAATPKVAMDSMVSRAAVAMLVPDGTAE